MPGMAASLWKRFTTLPSTGQRHVNPPAVRTLALGTGAAAALTSANDGDTGATPATGTLLVAPAGLAAGARAGCRGGAGCSTPEPIVVTAVEVGADGVGTVSNKPVAAAGVAGREAAPAAAAGRAPPAGTGTAVATEGLADEAGGDRRRRWPGQMV